MDEAIDAYEQAVEHAPEIIWYHINLMTTLLSMGRREDALSVIEGALRNHPENANVWARHGQVLRRLGKIRTGTPKVTIQPSPMMHDMPGHGMAKGCAIQHSIIMSAL